jgi:hypothetical protein
LPLPESDNEVSSIYECSLSFSVAEVMVLTAATVESMPVTQIESNQHRGPATNANDSELESGNEDGLLFGDGDTDVESDNKEDFLPKKAQQKMRVEVRQMSQTACYLLMFCNSVLIGIMTTTTKRKPKRQLGRRVATPAITY